jgi:hypothetical protein
MDRPDHWSEGAWDHALEPGIVLGVGPLVGEAGGDFSIKLEDQVLVIDTGCRNLTRYPCDARRVGAGWAVPRLRLFRKSESLPAPGQACLLALRLSVLSPNREATMEYVSGIVACLVTVVFAYVVVIGVFWAILPPEALPPSLFDLVVIPPAELGVSPNLLAAGDSAASRPAD